LLVRVARCTRNPDNPAARIGRGLGVGGVLSSRPVAFGIGCERVLNGMRKSFRQAVDKRAGDGMIPSP
jgi:hypothetical protein